MKTLIISNDDKIVDFYSTSLLSKGYDVIVYRWLMKALDNLEEIKPEIIIVNAGEYPRHWKTLASFLQSGLSGKEVHLYLYDSGTMEDEDKMKARALGVVKIFESLDKNVIDAEFKSLNKVQLTFPTGGAPVTDSIILTDPDDNTFSYGNVENQEGNTYICRLNDSVRYTIGQLLKYVSFCHDGNFTNCSAQVVRIDTEHNSLSLKIRELYEAV